MCIVLCVVIREGGGKLVSFVHFYEGSVFHCSLEGEIFARGALLLN